MTSRQAMEEYNDGTIYRIHVKRGLSLLSNVISVPVDIAQSELVGKVLIGLESIVLDRELYHDPVDTGPNPPTPGFRYPPYADQYVNLRNLPQQIDRLANNWCDIEYMQFRSITLPPDIDYTTQEGYTKTTVENNVEITETISPDGSNSRVFARVALPLGLISKSSTTQAFVDPRTAINNNLGKNGILTEMTNNPNAISNGMLHIQLIDDDNEPWNLNDYPIRNLQFVIVIYKPRNTYN